MEQALDTLSGFKRPQLRKPGRRRWRVCWRWFALWWACGDQCLMSWTRTFNCIYM